MSAVPVVIVGSGPGGAAFAWKLAAAGVPVRMLEAGPRYLPEDYRLDRNDWEKDKFPEKTSGAGRQTHTPLQQLDSRWDDLRTWNHLHGRMVEGDRRRFVSYSHVAGVGGTTLHYAGESHRMNPAAMKMNTRFGVAADWPFDYDELEPFYLEAERAIGVAGPESDPTRPRSAPYPLPPHAFSYATQALARGMAQLGRSWIPNPQAILSRPYDGRPPCNYCGQCARGCPRLDKGTADITLIDKALATGKLELSTGCRALRLETGENDRVKAVVYSDAEGQLQRLEAELFVLAGGAVETPRLLLNSAGAGAPDGLANESGQVGRNFMETLSWASSGLHPDDLGSYRGNPSDAICWDDNAPDAIPGVIGGARYSPNALEADFSGPINYAVRVAGGWGKKHHQAMREQFGRVLSVGSIAENLPNPGSFIDLDPEEKDDQGLPKARISSRLDEMELQRLSHMAKTCREILQASGVEKIIEEYGAYDMFNSTHVFGTCRMGDDPDTSVVDKSYRSHRWRNLMVTDASVFPSSGGGESPSLTIYANSLRAAEGVLKGP
jgi:choline dehydrogenase-like flavoprotein